MIDSRAASPVEFSCKFDKGTYSLSAGIDLTSLPNQFVWIARVSPFWALELQVCSLPPSLCDFWGSELQPLSLQSKYFIHGANPTLPNNFFSKVISYFVRSFFPYAYNTISDFISIFSTAFLLNMESLETVLSPLCQNQNQTRLLRHTCALNTAHVTHTVLCHLRAYSAVKNA